MNLEPIKPWVKEGVFQRGVCEGHTVKSAKTNYLTTLIGLAMLTEKEREEISKELKRRNEKS